MRPVRRQPGRGRPGRSAFRRARGSGPAKWPSCTYSFRRIVRGTANTAMRWPGP